MSRKSLRAEPDDRVAGSRARKGGDGGHGDGHDSGGHKRKGHGKDKPKKATKRSLIGALVRWVLVLGIWAGIGLGAVVAWFAYDLPDVRGLYSFERRPSVTLLAADGTLIATFGDLYADPRRVSELPPYLIDALVATEDRRYWKHFGIDPFGLLRAMVSNARAGRMVQGGSTITQQLAKNVFLNPERNLKRKVQELLLAFWLERNFDKTQILELYLNRVYFGGGAFGIEAAARRYFDKPATALNLQESAMLIGLLKAPSRYSPANNLTASQNRARQVIANMVDAGLLDETRAKSIETRPAKLADTRQAARNARYYADWVLDDVYDYVGRREEDLVVQTTLDTRMQAAAERAVEAALAKDGDRLDVEQAALVALAPDGAVRALVGGRDYRDSVFNRATQAHRQPGSAFKPFVFLAAIEQGIGPDDSFVDGPITIGNWRPRNFDEKFAGTVTLREAAARSINTVAVQVSERVGRGRVIEAAHRLGIQSEIRSLPSLALGANEVTLLELTGAYAPFANGGDAVIPHGIIEIRNSANVILFRRQVGGIGKVVGDGAVAEMNELLSGVIQQGTGRAAHLDRPAAGKTGTATDYRDAWFVGYTRDLIAGVWVGNDDASAMNRVTGGGLPSQIWRAFMMEAHKGREIAPLPGYGEEAAHRSLWDRILGTFGGEDQRQPRRASVQQLDPALTPVQQAPSATGEAPRPGEVVPQGTPVYRWQVGPQPGSNPAANPGGTMDPGQRN